MGSSRLQAPTTIQKENPNLVPLPSVVDINSFRGRFHQVNIGQNSAEEQTRVPVTVVGVAPEYQAVPISEISGTSGTSGTSETE